MLFAYLEIMQYFTQGNSIFIYTTEAIARTFQFMQKPQGVAMFISKGNYIAKYCGMLQKLILIILATTATNKLAPPPVVIIIMICCQYYHVYQQNV